MADKVVFVILEGFADWEYGPLAAALTSPEHDAPRREVLFASVDKQIKTSIGQLRAQPDLSLEEVPQDALALVLVGGTSWHSPQAEAVGKLARQFLDQGKVVGGICDAARFLGAQGLLNHHSHTANSSEKLLEEPGYSNAAGFVVAEAVRDGTVVTANGNAAYPFARELLLALGDDEEQVQMWYDFYTMGFHAALAKYFPEG